MHTIHNTTIHNTQYYPLYIHNIHYIHIFHKLGDGGQGSILQVVLVLDEPHDL